jgi:hypothetical protein
MTAVHEGGCLCADIRYRTLSEPVRVTICHCTFCQKLTGAAFLVEPIFKKQEVVFSGTAPRRYVHCSDTSKKEVGINFCSRCGTTLFLDFERFPDILGLCGGTFDNPNWFERDTEKCRHIFTRSAQTGVLLPPGVATYSEHALRVDGAPNEVVVLAHALMVSKKP